MNIYNRTKCLRVRNLFILLIFFALVKNAYSSDYMQNIEQTAVVLIRTVGVNKPDTGLGSGLLLWNYQSKDSVYLLTANHVLVDADKIRLLVGDSQSGYKPLSNSWIHVRDSVGKLTYMQFIKKDSNYADIALVSIYVMDLERIVMKKKVLSRSYCVFGDSLFLGDRILMCGFADKRIFDFVSKGDFLVTSGTLAYKGEESFLVDQKAFHGMSGGIVFKEYPNFDKFGFKAAGIVIAGYTKYKNYSWIVKLDYIDSILISNKGHAWGEKK